MKCQKMVKNAHHNLKSKVTFSSFVILSNPTVKKLKCNIQFTTIFKQTKAANPHT